MSYATIEWGVVSTTKLTFFATIAGFVALVCGDGLFPVIVGLLVGIILVLVMLCRFFIHEHIRIRKQLRESAYAVSQLDVFADRCEALEKKRSEYERAVRTIDSVRYFLKCPYMLCIPSDPVISLSTDRVMSSFHAAHFAEPSIKCIRFHPLSAVCREVRMFDCGAV